MKLPIADIIIGERQRIDLGDLEDLTSMSDKDVGQILPIVVHKTLSGYELVDGRRRIAKATSLGWSEIECHERDLMTNIQKQKAELFADIGRKDRTWQETCLAVNKIHTLLVREKRDENGRWTQRMTARSTGLSLGNINYFLRVATELERTPRDEQLWSAASFVDAIKVLLQRSEDKTRAELELRRQAVANQDQLPVVISEEAPFAEDGSPVQELNSTEAEPALVGPTIWLRGQNQAFDDRAKLPKGLFCVICYDFIVSNELIEKALSPLGHLVRWNKHPGFAEGNNMGWPLIWNRIATGDEKSKWPFVHNYVLGHVTRFNKEPQDFANPKGSVVSCMPTDNGTLPPAVLDLCLDACCPPNYPVLILGNIDPVTVAETGHPPIFFEPDAELFAAKTAALREHYEQIIPGVQFKQA